MKLSKQRITAIEEYLEANVAGASGKVARLVADQTDILAQQIRTVAQATHAVASQTETIASSVDLTADRTGIEANAAMVGAIHTSIRNLTTIV